MSENNFTHAHALVGMFIEMTAADGQMDKVELQLVGGLINAILEPVGYDKDAQSKLITESFDWWGSFDTFKDRANAVFTAAKGLTDLDKPTRIIAARGLMMIGRADGEVDEMEKNFLNGCLECMGLTFDDLKN
jgi:uncharacterized tellurite resistance protein B-like protein